MLANYPFHLLILSKTPSAYKNRPLSLIIIKFYEIGPGIKLYCHGRYIKVLPSPNRETNHKATHWENVKGNEVCVVNDCALSV